MVVETCTRRAIGRSRPSLERLVALGGPIESPELLEELRSGEDIAGTVERVRCRFVVSVVEVVLGLELGGTHIVAGERVHLRSPLVVSSFVVELARTRVLLDLLGELGSRFVVLREHQDFEGFVGRARGLVEVGGSARRDVQLLLLTRRYVGTASLDLFDALVEQTRGREQVSGFAEGQSGLFDPTARLVDLGSALVVSLVLEALCRLQEQSDFGVEIAGARPLFEVFTQLRGLLRLSFLHVEIDGASQLTRIGEASCRIEVIPRLEKRVSGLPVSAELAQDRGGALGLPASQEKAHRHLFSIRPIQLESELGTDDEPARLLVAVDGERELAYLFVQLGSGNPVAGLAGTIGGSPRVLSEQSHNWSLDGSVGTLLIMVSEQR